MGLKGGRLSLGNGNAVTVVSKGVQAGGVDQWQSTCLTGARPWARTSKPEKKKENALKIELAWGEPDSGRGVVSSQPPSSGWGGGGGGRRGVLLIDGC